MRKAYKIILTPTEPGYMVTVPDFNCNTQGEDIAEALFMARDVIGVVSMAYVDEGKEIPEPDSVEFQKEANEIITYVDVDFAEYRRKYNNRMIKNNPYLSLQKIVNEFCKQGHQGYKRCLVYMHTYSLDELEYFELEVNSDLEANERKSSVIAVVPVMISLFSIGISSGSPLYQTDPEAVLRTILCIILLLLVVTISYLVNARHNAGLFARKKRLLQIIQKVKEEKKNR